MINSATIRTNFPWKSALSWFVGLFSVINIILANTIPIEVIRGSIWKHTIPLVYALCFLVTADTAFREILPRKKVAWILLAAAHFLLMCKQIFRSITFKNETFIVLGVFIFFILGLIVYFPRSVWSLGSVGRVVCDMLVLSFSLIALLQSSIYYVYGETAEARSAAAYSMWVGPEIAGLINTIFLWRYYRQRVLGLIVLAALCIVLADVSGIIRNLYPFIYKGTSLPDISFNYLQTMLIMMFAHYSVEHFNEDISDKKRDISSLEWFYRASIPLFMFICSIAMIILVHRPDAWLIPVMLLAALIQLLVSSQSQYHLVKRSFDAGALLERINAELTASNQRLIRAQQQLKLLLEQIEELTLDQERARIAREIHDGLGQYLHAAKLFAGALIREEPADERRESLYQAVLAAQIEMRRAITALDESPQQTIEEMLAEPLLHCRLIGLKTDVRVLGVARPVSATLRHTLLRIAQEAMNNITKYAQATHVYVTLDYHDPDSIALSVADDGHGFTERVQESGHGNGLRNMRERAEALGGECRITSTTRGVTVWTRLPTSGS